MAYSFHPIMTSRFRSHPKTKTNFTLCQPMRPMIHESTL